MSDLRNDIEKYWRGELTPSEMHALEKKALDDPFLADALEGGGSLSAIDFSNDLNNLTIQLEDKIKGDKKTVSLWIWPMRIAAGLLLIALSTFVVLNFLENSTSQEIAQNKAVTKPPKVSPEELSKTETKQEAEKHESSEKTNPNAGSVESSKGTNSHATPSQSSPAIQEVVDAENSEILLPKSEDESTRAAKTPLEENVSEEQEEVQEQQEILYDKTSITQSSTPPRRALENTKEPMRLIKGQVTSEDGKGIPGVNIFIEGTDMGTITDAEGNYEIGSDNDSPTLVFSFLGYENTEVNATFSDGVNVTMREDVSQLSEVVVVGYATEGVYGSENSYHSLELAAPAGGRKVFKQYLVQNMRYPEQALENEVEGKVTVQFIVENTGALSDFKVIKGLGYGCDEEVIRLIKEGPKWMPTKRASSPLRDRVKVRLKFSLPKK